MENTSSKLIKKLKEITLKEFGVNCLIDIPKRIYNYGASHCGSGGFLWECEIHHPTLNTLTIYGVQSMVRAVNMENPHLDKYEYRPNEYIFY